ncbi:11485_t:CDS:2 [Scutellospora calospora]|uniref:11485_t:CDS:1 n=1 Tax=Scutellospora calospora TaxID=85575 RepID=A0ACA9KR55_9GLOM|nr:11485_t:CDS:2 [Scutellospora calospora]
MRSLSLEKSKPESTMTKNTEEEMEPPMITNNNGNYNGDRNGNNNNGAPYRCHRCGELRHISRNFLEDGNPLLIEVDPVVSPPKPRRKRGPSVIDKLDSYDMAVDIMNQRANVTLGQILRYPDQRKKLVNALKRPFPPTPPIPTIVQVPEEMETNAAQQSHGRTTAA